MPGIGDKTARELVASYGDIDSIYQHVDSIKKPSVAEKLREGKDLAYISKDLATLRLDVCPVNLEDLTVRAPDLVALRRIFRELEFTSLYKEIKIEGQVRKAWPERELSDFNMERVGLVASFHGKGSGDLHLTRFAAFDGTGIFHSESVNELIHLLERASSLAAHNLKPLYVLGANHGIKLPEHCFDTMLATYLVNPLRKDYGISSIVEEYLDVEITSHDPRHALADVLPYMFELTDVLAAKMEELGVLNLFRTIEMPLIEVLASMEEYGVRVDRKMLGSLSRDFDQRLNGLMKNIYALAGESFNINSPQQLSRILFESLGLPPSKKTKKGFSTDIDVLQSLSSLHALPREILEYRSIMKLKSTYVDVLPVLINPRTGRIHTSFNQMVVSTGRLSSTEPNLQNIPIRGEEGVKIRRAFVPEDGFVLLSSDYSQIELRILAHLSGDEILINTFLADEDVHSRVAREVFGVEPDRVTSEMRRTAKVINFGIIYGISGYGLSKELGVPPREAQDYIDAYFARHKGVKAYIDRTIEEARDTGFVKTLFGRIRYIPEINNPDANIRQLGERLAMNTPVQGTAADVIKLAMVQIFRKLKPAHPLSRLIMQIHDELVFEVKEEELESMEKLVTAEMENVIALSVPLKVNLRTGKNWAEAHD